MTINPTTPSERIANTSGICQTEGDPDFAIGTDVGPSIHELGWTPYERDERDRVVVLLVDQKTASWVAVHRASRISDALDARLHVVLAVPRDATTRHPVLVIAHVSGLLNARRPRRGFDLEVVAGSIAEHGVESARGEFAELVVVDARVGQRHACGLVDQLGIPVLVARDARPDGEWIAASDMQHLRFPVLSIARDYARALDREIVYFHNARPLSVSVLNPMAGSGSYLGMLALQDDAAAAKQARLRGLASDAGTHDSIVTRDGSTVGALLGLARDRDADMVVVGHRPRTWLRRLVGHRTTERIVECSRRSVLVVPLENAA